MFTLIRSRIIAAFIVITLLVSTLFVLLGLVFSYEVEDRLFYFILNSEQSRIEQQQSAGETVTPYYDFIQYFESQQTLPEPIRSILQKEPNRGEFTGEEGKHYHLIALKTGFLLAEVSEYLVVRKIKTDMALFALVLAIITSVFVAMIAWFLARHVTQPIKQLQDIIVDAPDGQLPMGFSKQFKRDEIGLFATTLDNAMQRMQAFVLRERHFTRDVSHELRTPIAICQGALTLLNETQLDPQQQTLVTRLMTAQTDMQQSVEGLLTMARETSLACSEVKVLPIIENVILMHHQLIADKMIEVVVNVDRQCVVTSNAEALKIIVSNLVSNAFRYTKQGRITLAFNDHTLSICDTGHGIQPSMLQSMFSAGIKGHDSLGHGFGLAIVKRLCKRLEIDIKVDSDSAGSVFSLTFKEQ